MLLEKAVSLITGGLLLRTSIQLWPGVHGFRAILAAVLSCSSKAAVKVLILSSVILYQLQEPYLQTRRACLLTHADIGVICSTVCKHLGSDDQRWSENEVTLFFYKTQAPRCVCEIRSLSSFPFLQVPSNFTPKSSFKSCWNLQRCHLLQNLQTGRKIPPFLSCLHINFTCWLSCQ